MATAAMAHPLAYARSMCVVCTTFSVGDIICQRLETDGKHWKQQRTAEFATVGGLVMGPASHTLEWQLERIFPGVRLLPVAQKVLSRVVVSPLFLSLNFGSLALLRGDDVRTSLSQKVLPAWQTGCLFWPGVAAFTYRFVPLTWRPTFGACVGCVWSCYLSYVAHKKQHDRMSWKDVFTRS